MTAAVIAASFSACGGSEEAAANVTDTASDSADSISKSVSSYKKGKLSDEEISQLTADLLAQINSNIDAYESGAKTYDEVIEVLTEIREYEISELNEEFAKSAARLAEIKQIRDTFDHANEAFGSGDYKTAISGFAAIPSTDINYAAAQENLQKSKDALKDSIFAEADALVSAGSFDEAIDLLHNSKAGIDDDTSAAIDQKIDDIEFTVSSEALKDIFKQAEDLAKAGKYDEACEYLADEKAKAESDAIANEITKKIGMIRKQQALAAAEALSDQGQYEEALSVIQLYSEEYGDEDDAELQNLTTEITDEYVSLIMDKVNKLCDEENYFMALEMLSNAQLIVDAPEFKTRVEDINAVKPIYLCDIKISDSANYEQITTGDKRKDTVDNTYAPGNLFVMWSRNGWSGYSGEASYFLGYKYSKIKGTVAVHDESDRVSATLTFYGDDLVLHTIDLSRLTAQESIEIDVSNVNWFKINLAKPYSGDGQILTIFSDFVLEK